MAFNTKIRIDDQHVEQVVNSTLTLSGNTRYATHPNFTGDTQIIDKKYVDDNIVSATGGTIYNLESPAAVSLGGITAGSYVLTGKTANEILQDLLVPELYQTTVGTPSTSLSVSTTGIREVGAVISTLTVDPTYNGGTITPLYDTVGGTTRGGAAISYCYSGPSMGAGFVAAGSCSVSNYAVTAGVQTWNACTCFDDGATIRGSKGTLNPSVTPNPLTANCTVASAGQSITGYYPVFYGYSATKPTAGQALLTPSTSKQILSSTGNLTINFGSGSGFMWFAVPSAGQTPKVKWVETGNEVNNGPIGASQLFESRIVVPNINSPELTPLWTNQSYDFYIGGFSGNLDTYDLRTS
jgi:hypothetical protein